MIKNIFVTEFFFYPVTLVTENTDITKKYFIMFYYAKTHYFIVSNILKKEIIFWGDLACQNTMDNLPMVNKFLPGSHFYHKSRL